LCRTAGRGRIRGASGVEVVMLDEAEFDRDDAAPIDMLES
jgi:hypothetical protein